MKKLGQFYFFELGENEMAKKTVNKSQAIRDYLSANRNAMPKAIIEGLAAKGTKVSAALVSAVKYSKAKPTNGRRKKVGRPSAASANGHVDFDNLVQAKALADKMGGVAAAKSALDMLAKLT